MSWHNPFLFQDWRANRFRPKVADVRTLIQSYLELEAAFQVVCAQRTDAENRADDLELEVYRLRDQLKDGAA